MCLLGTVDYKTVWQLHKYFVNKKCQINLIEFGEIIFAKQSFFVILSLLKKSFYLSLKEISLFSKRKLYESNVKVNRTDIQYIAKLLLKQSRGQIP